MAIKFFAVFFPTISTFGCFWSQWPTSLAVTSGREGVRTTSFKPWRPHRGSCRGATAIEENSSRRAQRCGAGGCRREATWIWKSLEIIHFGFVQNRIPSHGGYHFPIKIATKWWPRSPRMGCQASERDKPQQTISHAAAMSTNYRGIKASRTLMLYRRLLSCKSRLMNWWRWWVGMNLMIIIEMMTTHGPQDVKPSTCRI